MSCQENLTKRSVVNCHGLIVASHPGGVAILLVRRGGGGGAGGPGQFVLQKPFMC